MLYTVCVKIFCSGIGGIGLSAYAALQKSNGHDVSGSDRTDSALLEDLRGQGIAVSFDQSGRAIDPRIDLFVYSEAVPSDASERLRAQELSIRSLSYPEALGELLRGFKRPIAVCGTHGKSSTTAMLGRVLLQAKTDPTIIVGTKMQELGHRNWRKGSSDLFLLEACEYRRSFLHYAPSIILLTTCDGDHFDYYSSHEEYREAFEDFLKNLPEDGVVITHFTDPICHALVDACGRRAVDADVYPLPQLSTPGLHMRQNARLALAASDLLGIPQKHALEALRGFSGTWRRMEVKGTTEEGITVIDDYAHHPAEIRATIAAMREAYPNRRLICVFQPHTHDRTAKIYDDFTRAFAGVDALIIPDIYIARSDIERETISLPTFLRDITKNSGIEAIDGRGLEETETLLRTKILQRGDVLLCMGAGNITTLSDRMLT